MGCELDVGVVVVGVVITDALLIDGWLKSIERRSS